MVRRTEDLLHPWLDNIQQTRIFQIGTGLVIREIPALLRPGFMNGATPTHPIVGQQDAGTVVPGFEGVFILQKPLTDLAVTDAEMSGHPVNVLCPHKQCGTGETITAVAGAVVAVRFIAGQSIPGRVILHVSENSQVRFDTDVTGAARPVSPSRRPGQRRSRYPQRPEELRRDTQY